MPKKSPFPDAKKFKRSGIPEIAKPHDRPTILYDDPSHSYAINGTRVASVTQILDETTTKPGLNWWSMRVGMAAVVALLQRSAFTYPGLMSQQYDELITGVPAEGPSVMRGRGARAKLKTELEAAVLDQRLSVNHIRDEAADQGTLIHEAITIVGVEDRVPEILDFELAQRPYIQAFCRWWLDQNPQFNRQEIIVASPRLAYAGRFDLELQGDRGLELWDFKTSKGVYESHFEQLDLYEEGALVLGDIEKPYAVKGIIHLRPDGNYVLYPSWHRSRDAAVKAVELYWARQRDKREMKPDYLKRD